MRTLGGFTALLKSLIKNVAKVGGVMRRLAATALSLMIMLFAVTARPTPAQPLTGHGNARPRVGAIRWDGYFRGSSYNQCFEPASWHYRIPFYGPISPFDPEEMGSDSQEIIDKEIIFAYNAGIDYFMFNAYPRHRDPEFPWDLMNASRDLYHKSQYKSYINYSIMVHMPDPGWHRPEHTQEWIREMQDASYERVGSRPLLYLLDHFDVAKVYGSWELAAERFEQEVLSPIKKAGLPRPYLVAMVFDDITAQHYINDLGFDAVSQYNQNVRGEEVTFASLAEATEAKWNGFRKLNIQLIPFVVTGYDSRPLMGHPLHGGDKNYAQHAMPAEIAMHLHNALRWTRSNPQTTQANNVLIYAWNEFLEGGWICPTHWESSSRLRAIAKVLRRSQLSPRAGTAAATRPRPKTGHGSR